MGAWETLARTGGLGNNDEDSFRTLAKSGGLGNSGGYSFSRMARAGGLGSTDNSSIYQAAKAGGLGNTDRPQTWNTAARTGALGNAATPQTRDAASTATPSSPLSPRKKRYDYRKRGFNSFTQALAPAQSVPTYPVPMVQFPLTQPDYYQTMLARALATLGGAY